MAQFEPAFELMIRDEGGYVLHEVPGDTGGMTYAGIARNKQVTPNKCPVATNRTRPLYMA